MTTAQDFEKYYDWMMRDGYTNWHVKSIEEAEFAILLEDSVVVDGRLQDRDGLHQNTAYWYDRILQLNPKHIFEVGFGCGNHLINLKRLLPETDLGGIEYSRKQIDAGHEMFGLMDHPFAIWQGNFLEFDYVIQWEMVCSFTVLMHIPAELVKPFLLKMLRMSQKYVVLSDWIYSVPVGELEQIMDEEGFDIERVITPPIAEIKKPNNEVSYAFLLTRRPTCQEGIFVRPNEA